VGSGMGGAVNTGCVFCFGWQSPNMNSPSAEEQIRTIRELLERATVYRALSVPGAAWAGILALAGGWISRDSNGPAFLWTWLAVLALAGLGNTAFLWRQAARDGRAFFSPGLRLALRGLWPPMLAGGVLGALWLTNDGDARDAVFGWSVAYGLALLATREFAPRSITLLGHAFFWCGLAGFGILVVPTALADLPAAAFMAALFGGSHLIYSALVAIASRRS